MVKVVVRIFWVCLFRGKGPFVCWVVNHEPDLVWCVIVVVSDLDLKFLSLSMVR